MPTQKLTNEIIAAAIQGFEAQKRRIDAQIAELRSLLIGGTAEPAASPKDAPRKRGKFSDATRLKMKDAQQRRWARIRGESEPAAPAVAPTRPKRQMSEASRQAIAEAARKRWATKKAAEKVSTRTATKRANRKEATPRKAVLKKAAVKVEPA
jgi:hypothetical protein